MAQRNHARVGRPDAGVFEVDLRQAQVRARLGQLRLGHAQVAEVAVDVLAHLVEARFLEGRRLVGAQLLEALELELGLLELGPRHPDLGELLIDHGGAQRPHRLERIGGDDDQHVAFRHPVANLRHHFGHRAVDARGDLARLDGDEAADDGQGLDQRLAPHRVDLDRRRLLLLRARLPRAAGQAGAEVRHNERQRRAEADGSGHTRLLNGPGASAGPSIDALQAARVPVSLTDSVGKWR